MRWLLLMAVPTPPQLLLLVVVVVEVLLLLLCRRYAVETDFHAGRCRGGRHDAEARRVERHSNSLPFRTSGTAIGTRAASRWDQDHRKTRACTRACTGTGAGTGISTAVCGAGAGAAGS